MSAFDAFGLSHAHTADGLGSAYFDPIGFGGQFGYYHDYQGRYLLGHRYYDALAGRFLTRDPIGYKGGINLYGFTGNNPVNESDPSGFISSPILPNNDARLEAAEGNRWYPQNLAQMKARFIVNTRNLITQLQYNQQHPGPVMDMAPGPPIFEAEGAVAEEGEEVIRLRHYTTTSGSREIEKDGTIIAKDQNKVFTESARRKALSSTDAERKYLLKRGHGNAHVEFNARRSEVEVRHNPLSGATEHVLNGNVRLEGRNPVFTRR